MTGTLDSPPATAPGGGAGPAPRAVERHVVADAAELLARTDFDWTDLVVAVVGEEPVGARSLGPLTRRPAFADDPDWPPADPATLDPVTAGEFAVSHGLVGRPAIRALLAADDRPWVYRHRGGRHVAARLATAPAETADAARTGERADSGTDADAAVDAAATRAAGDTTGGDAATDGGGAADAPRGTERRGPAAE